MNPVFFLQPELWSGIADYRSFPFNGDDGCSGFLPDTQVFDRFPVGDLSDRCFEHSDRFINRQALQVLLEQRFVVLLADVLDGAVDPGGVDAQGGEKAPDKG